LWRREQIGRPIAATEQHVVTIDPSGPRVVLRLIDAGSGIDRGTIENFGMPDWVGKTGLAPDAVQIEAAEDTDGIRLQWRLRQPYRGGAPPPPDIARAAQREVTGAVVIDPTASQFHPATPRASTLPMSGADAPTVSSDPTVYALDRVGDVDFALKAKGAGLSLEARDGDGTLRWELPLAELPQSRPMPQRK
jgi:hypothetical protein